MSAATLRDKTCFFAGHRDIPFDAYPAVQTKLKQAVESLIEKDVQYFGVGGALGFDTIAALAVLQLKREHPQIRLILILPCKGHDFSWQGKDKTVFEKIRKRADKVIYTTERYYDGCMYKRNRHMADSAGWGIVYLDRATGGTAYTVSYAHSVGVHIINLADDE